MKMMHSVLALTFIMIFSAVLIALPLSAEEKKTPEANVATVNGVAITQSDFDRQVKEIQHRSTSEGRPIKSDQMQALKSNVLERLIGHELLFQESKNRDIKIEETAMSAELDSFKKQFSNDEDFKKELNRMDMSEADLTSQIRRGLAVNQLIQLIAKQLTDKIKIPDKDIKSFFDENPKSFKIPEQVKASHILIKVDSQTDESKKTEVRKKIEEIQEKIKKGGDFAALAKESSQCPSSAGGGDLGFFGRGQMTKPFEDAAFALAPGEVSGIVETSFGYHIISLTDKKPGETVAYKDAKEKIQQFLTQMKLKEQIGTYIEGLEKKGNVERFMKKS